MDMLLWWLMKSVACFCVLSGQLLDVTEHVAMRVPACYMVQDAVLHGMRRLFAMAVDE